MLLLLLLSQCSYEKRLHIDALLKLSRRSAASICREAGVQPSNLTRFRQMGGENQISNELQGRLLDVLGWPEGIPDPMQTQSWGVFDPEGVAALEWLLNLDALRGAQFLRLDCMTGHGGSHMPSLAGKFSATGPYCHILFDDETLIQSLRLSNLPRVLVSKEFAKAAVSGKVIGNDLRKIFGDAEGTYATQSRLLPDLVASIDLLGITREEHNELLRSWLSSVAKVDPKRVLNSLVKADKLVLNGELIFPKAMTTLKLEQLVADVAHTQSTNAKSK